MLDIGLDEDNYMDCYFLVCDAAARVLYGVEADDSLLHRNPEILDIAYQALDALGIFCTDPNSPASPAFGSVNN